MRTWREGGHRQRGTSARPRQRLLTVVLAVVTVAATGLVVPIAVASGPAGANACLKVTITGGPAPDYILRSGNCLVNGKATLTMQTDGNLVSTVTTGGVTQVVWASNTSGGGNSFVPGERGFGTAAIVGSNGDVITSYGYVPASATGTTYYLGTNGNVTLDASTTSTPASRNGEVTTWQSGTSSTATAVPFTMMLTAGESVPSPSGSFRLVMQTDGNLVLYYEPESVAVWDTHTTGHPGAHAAMQTDGNLVVTASTGRDVLWDSGSSANDPVLMVQDDGNLVVYGTNTTGQYAAWNVGSSGFRGDALKAGEDLQGGQYLQSATGQYRLAMSTSGVLVLYQNNPYACPLWSVPAVKTPTSLATVPVAGSYLTIGTTGDARVESWHAGTSWTVPGTSSLAGPTDYLKLQTDGNLVLYNGSGRALWSTGTETVRGSALCTGTRLYQGQYLVPWDTGSPKTAGENATSLTMQQTCNLVLYQGGAALWSSATDVDLIGSEPTNHLTAARQQAGTYGGCYVVQQSDGNLVMYGGTGRIMWESGTNQSSTPLFDAAALGPYLTVPIVGSHHNVYVATSHGKVLGTPDPPTTTSKHTWFKIFGGVLDGLSLLFTFVGGPIGAYVGDNATKQTADNVGLGLGIASIVGDALGAANGYLSAARATSTGSSSAQSEGAQIASAAVPAPPANLVTQCSDSSPSKLVPGTGLGAGGCLASDGGTYKLIMQTDGNLVLYDYGPNPTGSSAKALWASFTSLGMTISGQYAMVTPTGDFVVAGSTEWSSTTTGSDPELVLGRNGNLKLSSGASVLWQTSTSGGTVTACSPSASPSVLMSGQTLQPGSCLYSPNGQYKLAMQTDGNLVEYLSSADEAIWTSGTTGHTGAYAMLNPTGYLEIYYVSASGRGPIWSTPLAAAYALLSVQNDGNVVLYGSNGKVSVDATPYAEWQTGTQMARGNTLRNGALLMPGQYLQSTNGQYKLTMGTTGLLQLTYLTTQTPRYFCPLWSAPAEYLKQTGPSNENETDSVGYTTPLRPGSYLIMQGDGNLVLSPPTASEKVYWDSGTQTTEEGHLVLETTGNLVVETVGNGAVWTSNSNTNRGNVLCTDARLYGQRATGAPATQYLTGIIPDVRPATSTPEPGKLVMQRTCNLVFYERNDYSKALWSSGTDKGGSASTYQGCYVVMQSDGNLVMYDNKNTVMWSSASSQSTILPQLVRNLGPYSLVTVTDQLTVVLGVYTDTSTEIWSASNRRGLSGASATVVQALVSILVLVAGLIK